METKASKRDPDTYESKNPQRATSYDTSQPENDTPQEIREGEESVAQLARQQEAETGEQLTPGADGVSTSS